MIPPEQIAELRAADAKATPGPWDVYPITATGGAYLAERTHHAVGDPDAPDTRLGEVGQADAELIALMRSALPALLDAAERCGELETEARHRLDDIITAKGFV